MLRLIFVLLILPTTFVSASTDLCDILDIPNCRGVTRQLRRNTFQTAPSTSTAVNLNPANVSFDRGVGLDVMFQARNPLFLSLTSGTGKMGGALISGSLDNSFFGNRLPELDSELLHRYEDKQQFQNKKLSLAFGAKLISKKNLGLDVGVILKRHPEIKDINPGAGLSGRVWKIHFGASVYKDDMFIDLNVIDPSTGLPYSVLMGEDNI